MATQETRGNEDSSGAKSATTHYDVTALELTIYYNREGDHDHNGMIFALTENVPILKYIRALGRSAPPRNPEDLPATFEMAARTRAVTIGVELPITPAQAREPHPLVRPLVLRARVGDHVTVKLENEIRDRHVGIHLISGGYDVKADDGSHVGNNDPSLVAGPGASPLPAGTPPFDGVYDWRCDHEGVFPFHDGGNYSGGEDGTNVHGLFGALIVEPAGSTWRDPVTGRSSHGSTGTGPFQQLDGLYLDVLPGEITPAPERSSPDTDDAPPSTTLSEHDWGKPQAYFNFQKVAYREFVIFFHDEPEFIPPHGDREPNPCERDEQADAGHGNRGGNHGGGENHFDVLPIMPISYRAEPMVNREQTLWQLIRTGHDFKGRPVLNEEQHHSSWMFGDPVTPILKAYIGDPVRIRFVHGGVKETHVFHLHLYEWHAVPEDRKSPRIDAISVSPQTGHTIEPVWGAGNRHQVAGDVIWHCHLYPHFHEGMWGIFRTFETRQDGEDGPLLSNQEFPYTGRRIGRYPDGTRIERLLPLPNCATPPVPTDNRPGYPLYIPGEVRQKSPIPPWPDRELTDEERTEPEHAPPPYVTSLLAADMPIDFDYRPVPTDLERLAFNEQPVPGELFTRNPLNKQQAEIYHPDAAADYELREDHERFLRNDFREVAHDVVVAMRDIEYNSHGWHDKHGHLYYFDSEGEPATRGGPMEPLFFRAQHGQIVNVILRNDLPETVEETEFDHAFPPCPALPWEGECATHVHMVKFDPICGDGASVGWNYMNGARFGKKMVYRWWADRQFGTIFFHDHLFANYRQKHGLFGALIVEPAGSRFFHHVEPDRQIVTGVQAMIQRHAEDTGDDTEAEPRRWFREFCIGIADFIPMWTRLDQPLNPPAQPGGHGDQGVMGLNYRNAPVRERPGDPAYWFSSRVHGDPDTTLFKTYANDPIWLRLVQGSHEEQHSFQIHGLRWRRFRDNLDSDIRNQQTFGIAEAFTFINQVPFGPGDYLYKLSAADDLWLGCWGLIRALARPEEGGQLDLPTLDENPWATPDKPFDPPVRRFWIVAEQKQIVYRDADIVDPFGLVYRLKSVEGPDGYVWPPLDEEPAWPGEPLVLWCREGERVIVEVQNGIPKGVELEPEPFAPEVPVEKPDRPVSSHVSMHADLVTYAVQKSDGTNAGLNPPQTVPPGQTREYSWDTFRWEGDAGLGESLGPVLLQDMADFRNHRHHGLIGALVILAPDATPREVLSEQVTAGDDASEIWHGTRVTVVRDAEGIDPTEARVEHIVLLMQDGLRLFLNGNPGFPMPDDPPDKGEDHPDPEDQGQKAFNYRTEPIGPNFDPRGSEFNLANPDPSTPVWHVPVGHKVRFHLVGGCDKPRNYSFTIHGVTWPEHRFLSPVRPMVSSESAITCGTVRTFEFTPEHVGDHAYRSGVLKWAVPQGMWGILRVGCCTACNG